jgi:hypothetical protein
MEAGNPDIERVPSRPLYCRAEACPVDGFLEAFLGKGGCIFCKEGLCSASPLTLSMFSTAATQSTPETISCLQTETPPLR